MRITHLGHACVFVETPAARLLIDPGELSDVGAVTGVDAVLVTHQHADHVDPARVRSVLDASPGARLVLDAETAAVLAAVPEPLGLSEPVVAAVGDRLRFGSSTVEVLGGIHAPVYGAVPGCANLAYLIDDGALLHPGDSFTGPGRPVDVLAVPVDGPWLKLAEAIDYLLAVDPRVAVPIHEAETTDPGKYAGMLDGLTGGGRVHRLERGRSEAL